MIQRCCCRHAAAMALLIPAGIPMRCIAAVLYCHASLSKALDRSAPPTKRYSSAWSLLLRLASMAARLGMRAVWMPLPWRQPCCSSGIICLNHGASCLIWCELQILYQMELMLSGLLEEILSGGLPGLAMWGCRPCVVLLGHGWPCSM